MHAKAHEEDCKLANMDVNNAGIKSQKNKEGNAFLRPRGYTQCVLMRNNECKHNLFVYKKNPTNICFSPIMSFK